MAKVRKVTGTSKADTITVKATSATVNKKKLSVYTIGVTVKALGGGDVITITGGSQRTVRGDAGKDRITVSSGKNHRIYGVAGNDTITIGKSAGSGIKVYGGSGNDTIEALNKYKVTIYGDAGNDTITGGTGNDTLYGGKGDDTLTGGKGKDTFVYANGDGKDTITDYTANNDTLYISSGSISKTALVNSSKDLRFIVGSSGTVTLKKAANKAISLKDSRGTYTYTPSKAEIVLGSDFKGTMDTAAYLATVTVDGSAAKKAVTIKGNNNANVLTGGARNDSLYGYGGVDILDGGLGNNTLTGGEGIDTFLYSGGNDTITDYGQDQDNLEIWNDYYISTVTVDGRNVNLGIGLVNVLNSSDTGNIILQNASDKEILVTERCQGDYTLTFGDKTTATLNDAYGGKTFTAAKGIDNIDARAKTANLTIWGNIKNNVIYAGKSDSTIYGFAGDNTLCGGEGNDTLSGAAGNDTLTGGAGNDTFVYANGGGNDTITDYTADDDTLYISSGSISATALINQNKDVELTVGAGKVTLTGAADKTISLKDSRGTYTASKAEIVLESDFKGTMDTAVYLGTVKNVDGLAAKKAVTIIGNGNDNILTGGSGNDTLTGNAGKDTFVYVGGNDTITDYTQNQDKLEIEDYVRISNVATDSGNVNLAISLASDYSSDPTVTGNINLQNASGKKIQVTEKYQGTYTLTAGNKTTATLGQDYTGTIFVAANGIDEIDATATVANRTDTTKDKLLITGNSANNTICVGKRSENIVNAGAGDDAVYGNDGNDTLYGDAGNDTLYGGAGTDHLYGGDDRDTFYFDNSSCGSDIIHGFETNEVIKFASSDMYRISEGTAASYEFDGNDVLLYYNNNQGGRGTIFLIGAKGKTANIAFEDSGSSTPVSFISRT